MKDTIEAGEKEKQDTNVLQARLDEFKGLVDELKQTGTINDEGLTKIHQFYEDPAFAKLVSESEGSNLPPTSITNAINHVCQATFINDLSTSQFKLGLKAHTFFTQGSKESSSKLKFNTQEVIDITNDSDDEYDMGNNAIMHQMLHKLPWQTLGLTMDIVTPTLNAIKRIEDEDRAFFANERNVKEIFQLGLQALKNRLSVQGESSYISDSSNKR